MLNSKMVISPLSFALGHHFCKFSQVGLGLSIVVVAKILKGAQKPADLPVEQPTEFDW
jgi:hypothetical protein